MIINGSNVPRPSINSWRLIIGAALMLGEIDPSDEYGERHYGAAQHEKLNVIHLHLP